MVNKYHHKLHVLKNAANNSLFSFLYSKINRALTRFFHFVKRKLEDNRKLQNKTMCLLGDTNVVHLNITFKPTTTEFGPQLIICAIQPIAS